MVKNVLEAACYCIAVLWNCRDRNKFHKRNAVCNHYRTWCIELRDNRKQINKKKTWIDPNNQLQVFYWQYATE
jgi:hypothetical protein